jgi:tripartite-type tricarboxylate transporter receptor subunit TctC
MTFNPQGRFKNLQDVLDAARAAPGEVSIGITGRGSHDYLTAKSIEKEAGVTFKYVVFGGSSEAINALLGGHIDLVGMILSTAVPYYQQGQLGMLGISTDERLPSLPDVPTFKEQGINVFGGGALNYKAVGGPAGMPPEVTARLTEALKAAVADPEYGQRLAAIGSMAQFIDGPDMAAIAENYTRLAKEFLAEGN